MSYTKGPWRVGNNFWGDLSVFPADGKHAIIKLWLEPFGEEETKANANLIAAAPELLEALKAMVTMEDIVLQGWLEQDVQLHDALKDMFKQAEAAISKAEGEK